MTESKILFFRIEGMDCAEEVAILKRELTPIVGGENNLLFDILKGKMGVSISGNSSLKDVEVIQAVSKTGMKANLESKRISHRNLLGAEEKNGSDRE